MSERTFERAVRAWLDHGSDRTPRPAIDAVLLAVKTTPQDRAPWSPRRFNLMPAYMRLAAVAAGLAVAGVGALTFIGAPGPTPTPLPTPTQAPTAAPTAAPTQTTPGISGFTSYTSAVYGITFGYPDGWRLGAAATRPWQPGETSTEEWSDWFANPANRDGEEMYFAVWQVGVPNPGVLSHGGLADWFAANRCDDAIDACDTVPDIALRMCAGKAACGPAILVPLSESVQAAFVEPETGEITIVELGRDDRFVATLRYGGGMQLLTSILTTMDVYRADPRQIPAT